MKIFKFLSIIVLLVSSVVSVSCSNDDDNSNEPPKSRVLQLRVFNKINKSNVYSTVSDGNLYDVYAVKYGGNWEYQTIGDVYNDSFETVTLNRNFAENDLVIILYKTGSSKAAAMKKSYSAPSKNGNLIYKVLEDGKIATFTITEDTKFQNTKDYTNIADWINNVRISAGL